MIVEDVTTADVSTVAPDASGHEPDVARAHTNGAR